MEKQKYLAQGYITIPVMLEVTDVTSLLEAIKKLDETLHSETIRKVTLNIVKFNGEKLLLQSDDTMIEWDSVEREDELTEEEKEETTEKSSG